MKQYLQFILKLSIFIIGAGVIFYLLPREGQFKYEYQMGKPWNYGLIVAPFDFPIQKTGQELDQEKDTLLLSYHPYYNIDPEIYASFCAQLEVGYKKAWNDFSKKYKLADKLANGYLKSIESISREVYNQGIVSLKTLNEMKESGLQDIVIVSPDYTFDSHIEALNTPVSAYERMMHLAKKQTGFNNLDELIQRLNINNYLFSNLLYNQELSLRAKNELLSTISRTSGLVQTGERIINKGEVVDLERFRKLESYKEAYRSRLGTSAQRSYILVGQIALISVFMFMLYYFLLTYRKEIMRDTKDVLFIMLNLLFMVAITAMIKEFLPFIELYIIPFSILTIVMHTFFDSRVAIFVNIITVFVCSFFAETPFDFAILHILSGTMATYTVRNLNRRGQLIRSAFFVFLTYSVIYFALSLMQEGSLESIDYSRFAVFFANAILILFAYPLIFICEKVFGYLSNVTLIEISDTNHELLQELSEKAPGTFQHSLMVSALSQEAAKVLDANVLLIRVGAYFHDIGKMDDAACFTENQAVNYNPHKFLAPEESAKRIIDHVENGVRLARKHGLPQSVIDFIRMHHGRGQVKFFLNEYAKKHTGEKVDIQMFTYPGPSPITKETAILMMADAVEAASRSLKVYTDDSIAELVNRIINTQLEEGNFRYSPISFYEIEKVKEIFIKRLKIIYHTRVAYPSKEEISKNIDKMKD